MLNKLKELREDHEDGFTLIELLVVILIIGILASIAIPVFLNQRKTANDGAVKSDVRNAALVAETLLVDNPDASKLLYNGGMLCFGPTTITTCNATTASTTAGLGQKVQLSGSVSISASGTGNGYTISGWHANGNKHVSGTPLIYNSATGGLPN